MAPWATRHQQTPAVVGPQTQTWSSAAAPAEMSPWPQVAVQATQIGMAPEGAWPQTPTWPQVAAQSTGLSAWPSVGTGATVINPWLLSCFRALDQDEPLAVAQAQTSPWSQVASRPFTSACSSLPSPLQICLSPAHERLHLSHLPTPSSLTNHNGV